MLRTLQISADNSRSAYSELSSFLKLSVSTASHVSRGFECPYGLCHAASVQAFTNVNEALPNGSGLMNPVLVSKSSTGADSVLLKNPLVALPIPTNFMSTRPHPAFGTKAAGIITSPPAIWKLCGTKPK